MRAEALAHLAAASRGRGRLENVAREWWDSPGVRDIETERVVAVSTRQRLPGRRRRPGVEPKRR